ncbi:MAG: ATP-binding cassette domain-containing protein, partial [Verrucomicrobiota bacterium]
MLELRNVDFTIQKDGEDLPLLQDICLKIPRGHFMAIVGPSGCGKSTLLKTIAGINLESGGDLYFDGRNLSEEGDLEPHEFGYVPQFSIAYEQLTVEESIDNAIRLRLKTKGRKEMEETADRIMDQVGLDAIRDRRVSVLSGGQKRRLGLALELATNPDLMLCDEVTSGLDPKSENEVVHLLHRLAKDTNRTVISVTHSLG